MLTKKEEVKLGKFISLVLRHKPEVIGTLIDENGWTDVNVLLDKMAAKGKPITKAQLDQIVVNNNKKRYEFSKDNKLIRARQGHSLEVELGYTPARPPVFLYHGTAAKNVSSIRQSGLEKRNRHHVHLSKDKATAIQVGDRHGKPVVLMVRAEEMAKAGMKFYVTGNEVWLTEKVPPEFVDFPISDL